MSLTLVVHKQLPVSMVAMGTRYGDMICTQQFCLASSALEDLTHSILVWLARPSHLIAGALRAGRDGLAAVTISSHLFSANQMLLAGIPANSIHSLRELSHAAFRAMDFFLAGDRATRHGEDCSGLVSSLKERMSRRNLISQSKLVSTFSV